MSKKRSTPVILVAPLNWGLGHATRSIPIIEALLAKDAKVLLASDGAAFDLLQKEFPRLPSFALPAYNVRYPYKHMAINMLLQWPKIRRAIRDEHLMTEALVAMHGIDIVLSDNRFGSYASSTFNVFITHQLNIRVSFLLAEKAIASWNNRMLNRFDLCWVPDFRDYPGLSGSLSHPAPIQHVQYVGPLSRMKPISLPKKYDAVVILSGPEPQRSKLEYKIIQQAAHLPYTFLIVRGKTDDKRGERTEGNITTVGYLTRIDLERAIAASDLVIARSGYTTIMDLYALQQKAILIPTPGQTEQLYLADKFHQQRRFYQQKQQKLNLEKAMQEAPKHINVQHNVYADDLTPAIDQLLENYIKRPPQKRK